MNPPHTLAAPLAPQAPPGRPIAAARPAGTGASPDRRRHKRFAVARPGKVFRRRTQRYAPIVTRNLSFGGALIEIDGERPFDTGELIDVAVSLRRQAVLPEAALVRAIVVRAEAGPGDRQLVAVRYIQPAGPARTA